MRNRAVLLCLFHLNKWRALYEVCCSLQIVLAINSCTCVYSILCCWQVWRYGCVCIKRQSCLVKLDAVAHISVTWISSQLNFQSAEFPVSWISSQLNFQSAKFPISWISSRLNFQSAEFPVSWISGQLNFQRAPTYSAALRRAPTYPEVLRRTPMRSDALRRSPTHSDVLRRTATCSDVPGEPLRRF